MKGFDTLHTKSAVKGRNHIPLSNSHQLTADFGQINILKNFETIPGGEYPVEATYFCRTAPLVKPTYGKFSFKIVKAFVPFHQVAYDADAFCDGKKLFEGQNVVGRFVTGTGLVSFINGYLTTATGATAQNAQFIYTASDGSVQYRLFTNKGRYWMKLLNQLGFAIPEGVDLQTNSTWLSAFGNKRFNAYPLLTFFKLYNDYMSNSVNYNNSRLSQILLCIKYNKNIPNSAYSPATGVIDPATLNEMFSFMYVQYGNDYFTSAWRYPNAPIGGYNSSSNQVDQIRVPGTTEEIHADNNESWLYSTYASTHWSQRGADFLRAFDNWVRRNGFTGSREVQQMYSRFGIKADDYRSHYAQIFGVDEHPVQVGDVTATADSTGVPLGDYAGKAILNGSDNFTLKASDRGQCFVLGFFTVVPVNAYGFDRQVLRSEPFDYYTPEFDGIGVDAISVGEYFANPIGSGSAKDWDVYGYTERYNSYRYWRDQITGDFRDYRANGDMNTWHTGRNLEAVRAAGELLAQSDSVRNMSPVDSEYNRIFSVTSGDIDHFFLTCIFKCDGKLPILNLSQAIGLPEGDLSVPRNGNVIS